nr:FBP domain-containing protein [Motilibacter deserti]
MRASFVNCSRSEAKRMTLPAGLDALDWEPLDFLGWRDPRSPQRAYLVTPHRDGLVGLALRATGRSGLRPGSGLCNLCHSAHPAGDVSLLVAKRAGAAGRNDNTVGTYICSDLACSLYVRGLRPLTLTQPEPVGSPGRVERLRDRLAQFVDRALQDDDALGA